MRKLRVCSILTILVLLSGLANAQDFLVTAKGDTLKGKINVFVNGLDKRVQVTQSDKKKLTFSIIQIQSFLLKDEFYRPVKFGETYVFMKLLKQGYLSLYAFQLDKQVVYDGRYLLKLDGKGIEVPNLGFKRNMTKFLSECTVVSSQIEEGKLGYGDLNTIIDEFNNCIQSNTIAQSSKIAQHQSVVTVDLDQWNALETKIHNSNLTEKADVLEMIKDIKNKLTKGEQIPKFLSEALKNALKKDEALFADLIKNLKDL